jgi:hypothetical protein
MIVMTGGRGCRSSSLSSAVDHVFHVGVGHALYAVAEFLDDQFGGVGVDGLVLRDHHAVLHQRLDHVGHTLGHAVGELETR